MISLLYDSVVIRRPHSDKTHVARVGQVWRAHFIKDYWAPTGGTRTACGVMIPATGIIMATGSKTRCRTCIHLTGITEQSPAVHERLGSVSKPRCLDCGSANLCEGPGEAPPYCCCRDCGSCNVL